MSKRFVFILILFFCCTNFIFTQTASEQRLGSRYAFKDDSLLISSYKDLMSKASEFENQSYDSAMKYYSFAINVAEKLKDQELQFQMLEKGWDFLGKLQYNHHYFDKAIESFEQSLIFIKGEQRNLKMGRALIWIYFCKSGMEDYKQALIYAQRAIPYADSANNQELRFKSYNGAGLACQELGFHSQARDYFIIALEASLNTKWEDYVAIALSNIGLSYKKQSNYVKALEYYEKALEIDQKLNDQAGVLSDLNNIGVAYMQMSLYDKAIETFTKGIELAEILGNRKTKANIFGNLGIVYTYLENSNQALKYYFQALELNEKLNSVSGISNNLGNIGVVHKNQGDSARFKGDYILANKQYAEALKYYVKSYEMNDQLGLVKNNIAVIHLKKAYLSTNESENTKHLDTALIFSRMALNQAEASGDLTILRLANQTMSRIYDFKNQPDSALYFVNKMIQVIKQSLQLNYFTLSEADKDEYFTVVEDDIKYYYQISAKYAKNYPDLLDSSYNLALAFKGLSLKSAGNLQQIVSESSDTILKKKYQVWLDNKRKLVDHSSDKELIKESEILEKELNLSSDVFASFNSITKRDWRKIQQSLQPKTVMIEFICYPINDLERNEWYAAMVINESTPHPILIPLGSQQEILRLLEKGNVSDMDYVKKLYGTRDKSQTELYDFIWRPIEKTLGNAKRIIYSPVSSLHRVSFAALTNEKGKKLCENYELIQTGSTYLESGELLVKEDDFSVLFGGMDFGGKDSNKDVWKYLPGTLAEVKSIDSLLGYFNWTRELHTGKQANEANFKNIGTKASVIHVSTHGFFFPDPEKVALENASRIIKGTVKYRSGLGSYAQLGIMQNKNPLIRSGLVMSDANDGWSNNEFEDIEDGLLTAQEISLMDFRKLKLVVLSACETGLGDVKGSEGVYGLQRGFKMAGAQNILMSLWQVPDKETSEFMLTFYEHLRKSGNIAQSFKKTQMKMQKKYDPFYWAAFVLMN